jgi:hypothetical protein
MTVKNLDNDRTYHFKNLPGYITTWVLRDGELIGYVHDEKGALKGVCTFPISK